jgi:hypothetical protein
MNDMHFTMYKVINVDHCCDSILSFMYPDLERIYNLLFYPENVWHIVMP